MNIIHVITGLEDGGAEAVLYRLATFASNLTHVVISLGHSGKYGPMLEAAGVRVHVLGMPKGRVTISGLRKLNSILRQEKPQIVQTWMYHANLMGGVVARMAHFESTYWSIHHTKLIPGTTGASTRLVDWICARLSRSVPKRIITCAEEARKAHIANGYDANKFVVIPNGYDVSVFAPDVSAKKRVRTELGIAPETKLVGLVGRWDPQKDHANLFAAMREVRKNHSDLQLVLVGNGCDNDNAELVALLRQTEVIASTHLLGRRSDVPAIMNALDLHVLSSYSEAFPNVVAEAMACGTPCVVTDVGDAAQIVGDTGWVVPPRDADALANVIVSALAEKQRQPQNWSDRQHSARQRIVDKFSLAAMIGAYQTLWAGH